MCSHITPTHETGLVLHSVLTRHRTFRHLILVTLRLNATWRKCVAPSATCLATCASISSRSDVRKRHVAMGQALDVLVINAESGASLTPGFQGDSLSLPGTCGDFRWC
ncbi:unnamed protein product, partial [Timema podura]|nr:unnamed protein product [Timema podura]